MGTWVFVISLLLPSFGGDVRVTFTAADEESCWKLRKVIVRTMESYTIRHRITDCERS